MQEFEHEIRKILRRAEHLKLNHSIYLLILALNIIFRILSFFSATSSKNMIEVCVMVPLFTVPQHASHQKIIQQIKKYAGFQNVKLHHIQNEQQQKNKSKKNKKMCAQVDDLKITISQIASISSKINQINRENIILKKDLAELYDRFVKMSKQIKISQQKEDKIKEPQKTQAQSGEKTNMDNFPQSELTIEQFQSQIRKLILQKRSKQQTIQKLTVYCQYLLKIIENKKTLNQQAKV